MPRLGFPVVPSKFFRWKRQGPEPLILRLQPVALFDQVTNDQATDDDKQGLHDCVEKTIVPGWVKTARRYLFFLALARRTLAARSARPSGVSLSQQREQTSPWVPSQMTPQARQAAMGGSRPAFRALQRR